MATNYCKDITINPNNNKFEVFSNAMESSVISLY